MAAARHGLPVRLDRAPQRGAAFAITRASRRARTRSIGSRSRARGSSLIFDHPPRSFPRRPPSYSREKCPCFQFARLLRSNSRNYAGICAQTNKLCCAACSAAISAISSRQCRLVKALPPGIKTVWPQIARLLCGYATGLSEKLHSLLSSIKRHNSN